MADNQNIKGIRDDEPQPKGRYSPRGKRRKPFTVESRLVPSDNTPKNSVFYSLGFGAWWIHGRYETAARRDQAYAALVKKEDPGRQPRWSYWEYRKMGD